MTYSSTTLPRTIPEHGPCSTCGKWTPEGTCRETNAVVAPTVGRTCSLYAIAPEARLAGEQDTIAWIPSRDWFAEDIRDSVCSEVTDGEIERLVDEAIAETRLEWPAAIIDRDQIIRWYTEHRDGLRRTEAEVETFRRRRSAQLRRGFRAQGQEV